MTAPGHFSLAQVQAALFTPGFQFTPQKMASHLMEAHSQNFEGQHLILGLPPGAPPNMPRFYLGNDQTRYRLQSTPERVDFFGVSSEVTMPVDVSAALKIATEVLCDYAEYGRCVVGRMACILAHVLPTEAPGQAIASQFCRRDWVERAFPRVGDFEVHAHQRLVLQSGLTVNAWIRSKSAVLHSGAGVLATAVPVIMVEQDINTLHEELAKHDFASDVIASFFEQTVSQAAVMLEESWGEAQ